MRSNGVKVVPRTVHVYGYQIDAVHSVLGPVRLGLDEEHLFGEPVGGIGFLGVAVPDARFLEGDRRMFRITANRADGDEFFDSLASRLFHKFRTHDQVIVKKRPGVFQIGPDTAYFGRKMDHRLGPCFSEQPPDLMLLREVAFIVSWRDQPAVAAFFQMGDNVGTEETVGPGDEDALVFHFGPRGD